MEQTTNTLQSQTTQPPVNPPVEQMQPVAQPKGSFTPLVIAGIIVLVVGTAGLFIYKNMQKKPVPVVNVKIPPTPTPTPVRILSTLATQSAFLRLENTIASLSSQLNNYVVDDPSLSPPVLDLPLGYNR